MIGYYGNTFLNKAPLTSFKSWPSFMLIGRLLSDIDQPPYFLCRITCDPLLNLPEDEAVFHVCSDFICGQFVNIIGAGMDYNVTIIVSFLHVVDVLPHFPRSPSDSLFVYITVWGELSLLYSFYDQVP